MVKHIILWKLKSDVSDPVAAKAEAKSRLESLVGKIPGLHSLIVQTEGLSSSSADMMLDSTLEDEAALAERVAEALSLSGDARQAVYDSHCVTLGMAMYICMLADLAVEHGKKQVMRFGGAQPLPH